jgi:hypothetical protein
MLVMPRTKRTKFRNVKQVKVWIANHTDNTWNGAIAKLDVGIRIWQRTDDLSRTYLPPFKVFARVDPHHHEQVFIDVPANLVALGVDVYWSENVSRKKLRRLMVFPRPKEYVELPWDTCAIFFKVERVDEVDYEKCVGGIGIGNLMLAKAGVDEIALGY